MPPDRSTPPAFGAIILAAGASVRMGRPKQLLLLEGEPMLVRTIRTVRAATPGPVIVVLGANHETIAPILVGLDVTVAHNADWKEGMASSIRAGLRALLAQTPDVSAALIALADQPALSTDAIQALSQALREPYSIAAARYEGHLSAPVLFTREHFAELAALRGAEGAKIVFQLHANKTVAVDRPELAIDLDTPADLAAWQRKTVDTV